VVRLVFQTHRGPVVGTSEMLNPVSTSEQPFRFLSLPEKDRRTLQRAFESGLYRNIDEQERIEELRALVANWTPAPLRRHIAAKLALGVLGLGACLACALYTHLLAH
ncbi:MAG: hypothetical protein JO356_11300, partial [Acidobacteria bacterium]|nr:hypothetical protein [Acidobacteriota bacterium]